MFATLLLGGWIQEYEGDLIEFFESCRSPCNLCAVPEELIFTVWIRGLHKIKRVRNKNGLYIYSVQIGRYIMLLIATPHKFLAPKNFKE